MLVCKFKKKMKKAVSEQEIFALCEACKKKTRLLEEALYRVALIIRAQQNSTLFSLRYQISLEAAANANYGH